MFLLMNPVVHAKTSNEEPADPRKLTTFERFEAQKAVIEMDLKSNTIYNDIQYMISLYYYMLCLYYIHDIYIY